MPHAGEFSDGQKANVKELDYAGLCSTVLDHVQHIHRLENPYYNHTIAINFFFQ